MSHRSEGRLRRSSVLLAIAGPAALAVVLFGVALGAVLVVGLLLLCPLAMTGMHEGGGDR